jgi:hypothetical protein
MLRIIYRLSNGLYQPRMGLDPRDSIFLGSEFPDIVYLAIWATLSARAKCRRLALALTVCGPP